MRLFNCYIGKNNGQTVADISVGGTMDFVVDFETDQLIADYILYPRSAVWPYGFGCGFSE